MAFLCQIETPIRQDNSTHTHTALFFKKRRALVTFAAVPKIGTVRAACVVTQLSTLAYAARPLVSYGRHTGQWRALFVAPEASGTLLWPTPQACGMLK